jgi:hypothetical protein
MMDFSDGVRRLNPGQSPAPPDAASVRTDLGNPDRGVETLAQNQSEPEWLREMRGPPVPPASESPA